MTAGLLLIRRLRPIGEPAALRRIDSSGVSTLDGTAGAGRIVQALAEAGVRCDPVTQAVMPADIQISKVRDTDLGRRFDTVVLGSHLTNLPDPASRSAFLMLTARHVAPGGVAVIEHHPIDWAETAEDVEPTPGSAVGMEEVRRQPPFVFAVSVYDVGGRIARQPFTALVLSETQLAAALSAAGLRVSKRLGPTLLEAEPRA